MSFSRRQLLQALTVAGSTALAWRGASAQDIYPSKPLRFVIPFAAGGPADIVAGIGSSNHLSGELLAVKTGVSMTHIPYRGSAPAMNDLLGGGLQFMFDAPNTSTPLLRTGKLRALGTTGRRRHRLFTDLPAIGKRVKGYEFVGWMGIMAPPGLPPALQRRLAAETDKALAGPDTGDRLSALGLDVNFGGPDEVARAIAADMALWGPLIKSLGLRAE